METIFVTGGSGYIGSAVIDELISAGYSVVALARAGRSADLLEEAGARVVEGDLKTPDKWLAKVWPIDGVVHLAVTFGDDMAEVDQGFLSSLVPWMRGQSEKASDPIPLIYTGGLWLYGPSGDRIINENSAFNPPAEFAFMVDARNALFNEKGIRVSIVHPGLVWDVNGGAIEAFLQAAEGGQPPAIIGDLGVHWPLVHLEDLAKLYVKALQKGVHGKDYLGVGEVGIAVGELASAIAQKYKTAEPVLQDIEKAIEEKGSWVASYAYDQRISSIHTQQELGWAVEHPDILKAISD